MLQRWNALRRVLRDAALDRDALDQLVHRRLRAVLESAYRSVPHYRESMHEVGYNPFRDYRGPADLQRLPITTKQVLKQKGIEAFTREGGSLTACFRDYTSGSTGIPLIVYRNAHERSMQIAKWLRVLFLNGYSVFDKVMSLTGASRLREGRSLIQKFGLFRRQPVDYSSSPGNMIDKLLAYRPDVLYGGRSYIEMMCLEMERRKIGPVPLKLLIATNEMIRDGSRELCRKFFDVELTESYGSVEMGVMAFETPERQGLRLCEDLTYFEFLDDKGNPVPSGGIGRVVVTDLAGKQMPFIRYEQGDRVEFDEIRDPDGRARRIIRRILGRDDDYVLLPDGRRCTFDAIFDVVDEYKGIFQFRIIQRSRSLFQIQLVADPPYLSSICEELKHKLQAVLFPAAHYELVPVERIEADPNGKTRIFISEV
jgi:phenylacetate-CoA ligase